LAGFFPPIHYRLGRILVHSRQGCKHFYGGGVDIDSSLEAFFICKCAIINDLGQSLGAEFRSFRSGLIRILTIVVAARRALRTGRPVARAVLSRTSSLRGGFPSFGGGGGVEPSAGWGWVAGTRSRSPRFLECLLLPIGDDGLGFVLGQTGDALGSVGFRRRWQC
jgi:hypothetical protein